VLCRIGLYFFLTSFRVQNPCLFVWFKLPGVRLLLRYKLVFVVSTLKNIFAAIGEHYIIKYSRITHSIAGELILRRLIIRVHCMVETRNATRSFDCIVRALINDTIRVSVKVDSGCFYVVTHFSYLSPPRVTYTLCHLVFFNDVEGVQVSCRNFAFLGLLCVLNQFFDLLESNW